MIQCFRRAWERSWAAPIVPVLKADKSSVRICGDFRQTINPVSKLAIPKIEDLFATLSKGKSFTKLDLSQAYQQLSLEEESKQFVVINTTKGFSDITDFCLVSRLHLEYFRG